MIPIITGFDVVAIKPESMAAFAAFANHLSPLKLGITCAQCGQHLKAGNAMQDKYFSVTCGCREFRTENLSRDKTLDEVVADATLK